MFVDSSEHCNHLDLPLKAVACKKTNQARNYTVHLTPIFTFIVQYKLDLLFISTSIINSFALEFVVYVFLYGSRNRRNEIERAEENARTEDRNS